MLNALSKCFADCFKPKEKPKYNEVYHDHTSLEMMPNENLTEGNSLHHEYSEQEEKEKLVESPPENTELYNQISLEAKSSFIYHLSEDFQQTFTSDTFRIFEKHSEQALIFKSIWTIPFSARQFLNFFTNTDQRVHWDTNIEQMFSVPLELSKSFVSYILMRKIAVAAERDLVLLNREFEHTNGLLLVSTSIDHEELPIQPGIIRANLEIGGFFLQEIEGLTEVTNLFYIDLKGKLPQEMMKKLVLLNLKKFISGLSSSLLKYYSN